jgi:hypothetical protein
MIWTHCLPPHLARSALRNNHRHRTQTTPRQVWRDTRRNLALRYARHIKPIRLNGLTTTCRLPSFPHHEQIQPHSPRISNIHKLHTTSMPAAFPTPEPGNPEPEGAGDRRSSTVWALKAAFPAPEGDPEGSPLLQGPQQSQISPLNTYM